MDHEVARILATLDIDCDNDPGFEYHDELYYWKNAVLKERGESRNYGRQKRASGRSDWLR